jgi:hypothetical protein
VALTDGAYYDHMVFGFSKAHHSDYPDRLQVHAGHWKDYMPQVEQDVAFVADLLEKSGVARDIDAGAAEPTLRRFPGELPLAAKPVITHKPVRGALSDQDLEIVAQVASGEPLRDVSVYHRVMDQTRPWKRIGMTRRDDGTYAARIPRDDIETRFDLLYYLEARVAHGGTFWPDWQQQAPYVVVPVKR